MDIGVSLPDNHVESATELVDCASHIETLGYDSVWLGEHWAWNATAILAQLAAETERITFGPAIANVFSRTPALLAMTAGTLAELSDGRFRLGLGPSTQNIIENWHGLSYDRPLARTADAIRVIDRALSGEPVDVDGAVFDLSGFTLGATYRGSVPTYVAALGPENRRLTGRFADGWLPHMIPFDALAESFTVVADGAVDAGRDPDEIAVAPFVPISVDEDESVARDRLSEHIAYYLGTNEVYKSAPSHYGYESGVDAVRRAWQDGDREAANAAVPDEMIDAMGVVATPETARERVEQLASLEIDQAILKFPDTVTADAVERTIRAVAPDR